MVYAVETEVTGWDWFSVTSGDHMWKVSLVLWRTQAPPPISHLWIKTWAHITIVEKIFKTIYSLYKIILNINTYFSVDIIFMGSWSFIY